MAAVLENIDEVVGDLPPLPGAAPQLLLDTSVLSDFLAGKEPVHSRLTEYLSQTGQLHLSILTWYEIERGLRANGNNKRRRALERFVGENLVYGVDSNVLNLAADIWGQLRRHGRHAGDVDILIAATALTHGLGVATKDRDYEAIARLYVERWGATAT